MKKNSKYHSGQILIQVIVFGSIAIYLLGALVNWAAFSIIVSRQTFNREQAIQTAEAGVDYYRWHLAHAPTDFQDGTGAPGPYIHNFSDKNGDTIGEFSLDITPPPLGSTQVKVKSTGTVTADAALSRTVTVQSAKPSIAKYAVVANAVMRFGAGTEVFGPIHSNQGIRFDGLAHNVVTSAVASYDDPDHSGGNEFGVHTHVTPTDPLPPASIPQRTDVFEIGRQTSVPVVDFAGITADLAEMKADAQTNGFYRPSAGALGYHVVLRTDDTFDLYRVTGLVNPPSGCTNSANQSGWSVWSIQNQQLIENYPFPVNGIIFLEDDVFVDGQMDGGRLTMVAAFLPQLVRNNMYVQARSEVLGNIKSALETMSQEVRHASSVYTPTSVFDASPGQLSLETVRNAVAGEDYTFVDFFVDDGGLYVKKEGQVEQIIVSEKIQVESLTFTHLNSVDQHQAVRISITASFDTPSSEVQDQSRVTLTTTVSFRQY